MKQITYTKLIAEGFQSLATPFSIDLDQVGLNLVKGDNGEGKSTIFNAIQWAEYGENFKSSIATWEDKRTEAFRGTRVVIERTDGEYDYRIARHLDFKGTTLGVTGNSSLLVYQKRVDEPKFLPEHMVGSAQHKKDSQLLINDQLGIDSTTYLNSIIFGQRIASLVEADNKDKRELFEKLFAVDFVDSAKERADKKSAELGLEIGVLNSDIKNTESSIKTAQESYDTSKQQLDDFESDKKERVATAQNNVNKYNKHIKDAEDANALDAKALEGLTTAQHDKEVKAKAALEATLKVLETEADTFEKAKKAHEESVAKCNRNIVTHTAGIAEVKDKCPICAAPVKKEDVAELKKGLNDQIKAEEEIIKKLGAYNVKPMEANAKLITACKADIEKAKEGLKKFDNLIKDRTELETNIKNRYGNIDTYKGFLVTAQQTLDKEKQAKAPDIDLTKLQEKLDKLKGDLETDQETLDLRTTEKERTDWWIKKGFGANGIKAFVFNAMLTQLNNFSYKYAARLGFRVEFSIDMTKASKPFQTLIYNGDNVRDYKDLSGGQKQRVDICIAFAMHDLITQNTSFNIFVVDEMTEGLDNSGTEIVFEFLRLKAETKAVYMITHLDIIDSLNARIIRVARDENGSTIID